MFKTYLTMIKFGRITLFITLVTIIQSCKKEENPTICTEEFVTVGVTIKGKTLTNFYTVQKSTNDTINIGSKEDNWYPIIDDKYRSELKDKREYFYFIGEIGNEKVVNETYLISANECHIFLVKGKESIDL